MPILQKYPQNKKSAEVIANFINFLQIIAAVAMALEAIIRFISFISSLKNNFRKHRMGFTPKRS